MSISRCYFAQETETFGEVDEQLASQSESVIASGLLKHFTARPFSVQVSVRASPLHAPHSQFCDADATEGQVTTTQPAQSSPDEGPLRTASMAFEASAPDIEHRW